MVPDLRQSGSFIKGKAEGKLVPLESGTYTFDFSSSVISTLLIDSIEIFNYSEMNDFTGLTGTTNTPSPGNPIDLVAGKYYTFELWFKTSCCVTDTI